uniref:surfeit locus protein 1-like n=1 Tax=Erigeron canadensis TaxID=72917 RepID=UPI001CB9B831|nr:surfeit locus protein 1-like [Erigeron canadensis]
MASISRSFLTRRKTTFSQFKWLQQQRQPLSSSFLYSYSSSASVAVPELEPQLRPPTFRPQEKRWTRFLLFVPGAITFGLGTWQIFRRQEKVKMLEYKKSRLEMEPINCKYITPSGDDLDTLEFRRVGCKGVFDETKSIYVGPRSRSISGVTENGYYLITPLMPLPDSPESLQMPLLVNRGWVPRSWRDKSLKGQQDDEHPQSKDSVPTQDSGTWWRFWSKSPNVIEKDHAPQIMLDEVVGVIRGSEKPSIFVPANDPDSFQWFYVDVGGIACSCGLPENTIYIEAVNENVNPSNPYPIPKDNNALVRSSVMPQDHLNYTFTWYSLSAAVTFMAFKRLQPKKKLR